MRILYVIHQFYPETWGGTERFLLNLSGSMQRMGHHTDVVAYSFQPKSIFSDGSDLLARQYAYRRISVTAIRHNKIPIDINTSMENGPMLGFASELLRRGQYDLVHVIHPMRVSSFVTAAAQMGIACVLTLTDFWIVCPKIILRTSFESLCRGPEAGKACSQLCPELEKSFVARRLEEGLRLLRAASAVVAPSQFLAEVVQTEFPGIPIAVVPHGLSVARVQLQPRACPPEAKTIFAYCGGLAPHKGVHLLVNAFRRLDTKRAELRIYGAASAQERDYEQNLRRSAERDERIQFCGAYSPDSVAEVMQGIDVLVIPSLSYETYSLTLHEALGAGVPVIASEIGALTEKVRDAVTGWTFPLGDEAALAGRLRAAVENPAGLAKIRKNLREYTPPLLEEEAYQYERIYAGAASAKPGRIA